MTFEVQVEALTGIIISGSTAPTQTELTQFLSDGIVEVTNRITSIVTTELPKFTATTEDTNNSGVTIKGKVLSVVREHDDTSILRQCTLIGPGDRYEATNVDSLKYRSKYSPGYFILDGKIYTVPVSAGSDNSALVTQITYSTVGFGDSSINNFPNEYENLVVLYASTRSLLNALASKSSELPDIGSLTLSVAPPVAPSLSTTTISESGLTNPTFIAPVMDPPNWSDTDNWISAEEDNEMLAARVQEISVKIQEYSSRLQEAKEKFNEKATILNKDLQVALENAKYADSLDGKALQKYQIDFEKYSGDINKDIQEFTQNLQANGIDMQKITAEYQWMQQRYTMLKTEYDSAFALLRGPETAPAPVQQPRR